MEVKTSEVAAKLSPVNKEQSNFLCLWIFNEQLLMSEISDPRCGEREGDSRLGYSVV
jgi:hypothetical protein